MTDTSTEDAPVEEEEVEAEPVGPEQPTSSEELAVYQEASEDVDASTFEGVTDSTPGAVTELTPETSSKQAKAEGQAAIPSPDGFLQLSEDVELDDDTVVRAGTRVEILTPVLELNPENTNVLYPTYRTPEDAEVTVRTRDARGDVFAVAMDELESVAPGSQKG